nr:flavin-containing monooxygenase [Persicaria tinctoria]
MERKVGIIGAGISGLLACKHALSKGFHPVVLEAQPDIGGVWANALETTRLQTPKDFYQFSDFPWPSSVQDMHPTGEQVMEYIRSYADHFGLLKHVRFNTKVLSISFEGTSDQEMEAWSHWNGTGEGFANKGKWTLLLQDVPTQSQQVMEFNFVILGIGKFSDRMRMPEFPAGEGPEVFDGKVIHSKDYSEKSYGDARRLVKGKRVVVVGFQKSAIDIANECSSANGKEVPCNLIYRTPPWNIPDFFIWGLPLPYLYFNRFSELLLHKPGEGLFLSLLATILSPLRWLIAKFVESNIKYRHPLKKYGLVPEHGFGEAISSCVLSVLPKGFYENLEKGSILLNKAEKFRFCKEGIVMEGKPKPLEADLVIFATGFEADEKLRDIFASPKFQGHIMGSPHSILPLYRQCIHPQIPQLAIIGYSESFANLYTSEMRCRWIVELLDGTFKLPGFKEMEKETANWNKFIKGNAPKHYRRSCIGQLHIWYNDQLCKDMGWNPRRKKGFISEWFQPHGPLDYIG